MIANTFFLASASAMRTTATPTAHSGRAAAFCALETGPSAICDSLSGYSTYRSSAHRQVGQADLLLSAANSTPTHMGRRRHCTRRGVPFVHSTMKGKEGAHCPPVLYMW